MTGCSEKAAPCFCLKDKAAAVKGLFIETL